jgi:hypothetical protein
MRAQRVADFREQNFCLCRLGRGGGRGLLLHALEGLNDKEQNEAMIMKLTATVMNWP